MQVCGVILSILVDMALRWSVVCGCPCQDSCAEREAAAIGRTTDLLINIALSEIVRGLRMQRYYFHVKRGPMTVFDREGIELPDIAQAVGEATRRAQSIVLRERLNAVPQGTGMVIIADDYQTVQEVPF
jgi:hypothetical protein